MLLELLHVQGGERGLHVWLVSEELTADLAGVRVACATS